MANPIIHSSNSSLASNNDTWMVLFSSQGGNNDNAENSISQTPLVDRFHTLSKEEQEKFLQTGWKALQLQQATIEAQREFARMLSQSMKAHRAESLQKEIAAQRKKIERLDTSIQCMLNMMPDVCSEEQGKAYKQNVRTTLENMEARNMEPEEKYYAKENFMGKVDLELQYARINQLDFTVNELQLLVKIKAKEIALLQLTRTDDKTATAPTEEVINNDPQTERALQNEIEQLKIKLKNLQSQSHVGIVEVMSWEDIQKYASEEKRPDVEKEQMRFFMLCREFDKTWPVLNEKEEERDRLQKQHTALAKQLSEIKSSRATFASTQQTLGHVFQQSLQEMKKATQWVYNALPVPVITTFSGTTAVMLAPFFFRYFHSPS